MWTLLLACHSNEPRGHAAHPFPQSVPEADGLLHPSIDQDKIDRQLTQAYDDWADSWLVDAKQGAYRVKMGPADRAVTTSESQGYGLLLTAWFAGYDPLAQERFDGLLDYRLRHPSTIDDRLMDWEVPSDESEQPGDDDSAFDGDADAAYALLLADAQWGSAGANDYKAIALDIIEAEAELIGPDSGYPYLGDWVDADGGRYSQWTPRSSDFLPESFRVFADVTGDERWTLALDRSYEAIAQVQQDHSPETGLLPDFLVKDGDGLAPAPPDYLEGEHDGGYSYNACRDPWRIGTDALSGEERAADALRTLTSWARQETGGDPYSFASGYELDGTAFTGYHWESSVFVAPLAVAAMTQPDAQDWLDACWDAVAEAREGYYEDSVALLSMLTVSGRRWSPSEPPSAR